LLRFRDGLNVGKASFDGWSVDLTVASLLGGKYRYWTAVR
jgi:hypothetical protein